MFWKKKNNLVKYEIWPSYIFDKNLPFTPDQLYPFYIRIMEGEFKDWFVEISDILDRGGSMSVAHSIARVPNGISDEFVDKSIKKVDKILDSIVKDVLQELD